MSGKQKNQNPKASTVLNSGKIERDRAKVKKRSIKLDARHKTYEELEFENYLNKSLTKSFYLSDIGGSNSSLLYSGNGSNSYPMSLKGNDKPLIAKPINPNALSKVANTNPTLSACIRATSTNIAGHGYKINFTGKEGLQNTEAVLKEFEQVKNFLENINPHQTLDQLLENFERDKDTIGYGTLEIVRDSRGNVVQVFYLNPEKIYICKDRDTIQVDQPYYVNNRKRLRIVEQEFKIFAYKSALETIYYKEMGDPRLINRLTGKEDTSLGFEDSATEIFFDGEHSTSLDYPLPVWFGAYLSTLGVRESELVNLEYFRNNAIPAGMLLVSGGMLTDDSFDTIERLFSPGATRENQHKVVVIESTPDPESGLVAGAAVPPVHISYQSLADKRQSDALFQEYDKNTQKKILQCFRLPPILLGDSKDSSYAAAEASIVLTENQVFIPRRKRINHFINNKLLVKNGKRLLYHQVALQPSSIISPDSVAKTVKALENSGGMTPNVAINLLNNLFDMNIEKVSDAWGDYPFAFSKILASLGTLKGINEIADSTLNEQAMLNFLKENPEYMSITGELKAGVDTSNPKAPKNLANSNNLGSANATNLARDQSNNSK